MKPCDLRSDTVTRPTPEMRAAMAQADVGDDVYGEDPTVRQLEERVADLLGKEAALFVPSGTMGNQIALLLHTRPGDEVVIGEGSHCAWYESGAGAAWAGVQFAVAGQGGLFDVRAAEQVIKPHTDYYPRSSMIVLENTHNRAGGRVFPQSEVLKLAALARAKGFGLHLDGARIWNASIASRVPERELCAPFDTVSACFSKGLGAPVGSALAGTRDHIQRARRLRKMLGGGMRQAGVLAAAALYAIEHHRERLILDHASARNFAQALSASRFVELPAAVETNMVIFKTPAHEAELVVKRAAERGVLLNATGPQSVRAVTHLDVTLQQAQSAAETLVQLLQSEPATLL